MVQVHKHDERVQHVWVCGKKNSVPLQGIVWCLPVITHLTFEFVEMTDVNQDGVLDKARHHDIDCALDLRVVLQGDFESFLVLISGDDLSDDEVTQPCGCPLPRSRSAALQGFI